jgi:hypothetical protein
MTRTRTLAVIAKDLSKALNRETADIIEIGRLLIEAKALVDYGEWLPWLRTNFALSERTARNYMTAATLAEEHKTATVADLKLRPSALYELGGMSGDVVAKVFEAAKERWIDGEEASRIAMSILDPTATDDEPAAGPTPEQILAGPPPKLPPPGEPQPKPRDAALFETLAEAVKMIVSLRSVSAKKLTQSGVPISDLRNAVMTLESILVAMSRKEAA